MNRRTLIRKSVASGLAVGTVAIGGCSGDDSGNETASDGSDEEISPAPEPSGESMGSIGEDAVEELVIIDWESSENDFGAFQVEVTAYNEGQESADLFNYNWDLVLYDANGTDITGGATGSSGGEKTNVDPGEEGQVTVWRAFEGEFSDIASYEITLNCTGAIGDQVYCE